MNLIGDQAKEDKNNNVVITMWEIPDETPRLVLLCSEETKWFTVLNAKRQEKYGRREGVGQINLLVVTITINDDLNSGYGFQKASLSLRDFRDTMFLRDHALEGHHGHVGIGAGDQAPKRSSKQKS